MAQDLDRWKALASKELKGRDPETLTWGTIEGIGVKALYTAGDVAPLPDPGIPGEAPFLRGVRATLQEEENCRAAHSVRDALRPRLRVRESRRSYAFSSASRRRAWRRANVVKRGANVAGR